MFAALELGNLLPQNKDAVAAFCQHSQAEKDQALVLEGVDHLLSLCTIQAWQRKGLSERSSPAGCSSCVTSQGHGAHSMIFLGFHSEFLLLHPMERDQHLQTVFLLICCEWLN